MNVASLRVTVACSIVTIAFAFGVRVADAGAFAYTPGEQRCRDAMALGGLKLAQTAAFTTARCHKLRAKGSVPLSTDCNDLAAADSANKVASAKAKLDSRVGARCAGEDPAFLGYTTCPAPCDAVVPQINDFADAADCLACLIEQTVEGMSAHSQGSPSTTLAQDDARCHGQIGKGAAKHLRTILKERRRCQKNAERNGETTTAGCSGADPRGKIATSDSRERTKIADRCASADLDAVDSCAQTNALAVADCVVDDASTRAAQLFDLFYNLPGSNVTTTTTTTSTTTTTLPQDPLCPAVGEVTLLAKIREQTCTTNGDCGGVGVCDVMLGRCRTVSELDTGWTGNAHDADITDEVLTRATLHCSGPFNGASSEPCGVCSLLSVDPDPAVTRACRCASDNQQICDEPFAADADDCGGGICDCFLGPPLALSSGGVAVCVVNRYRANITGTVNVDTGEAELTNALASIVHLGESNTQPCPYCDGDLVFGDGVRDGTCVGGRNDGSACDVDGFNTSFPGPDGGGHSLDCFPSVGLNISGAGLKIDLNLTTGTAPPLTADIPCFFGNSLCHCKVCTGDVTQPCDDDQDCAAIGAGTCTTKGGGNAAEPRQNDCTDSVCNDVGGGEGECNTGPDDTFCDGITRADGSGYISCNTNADCNQAGQCGPVACGNCTLVKRRDCFLETIEASGVADPEFPVGAAIFCIPPTSNGGINSTAGLPGPGRVINQQRTRAFCASDPNVEYQPGVGGCP